MRVIDLSRQAITRDLVNLELPRANIDVGSAMESIRPLVQDIKLFGARPIVEFAMKFDGIDIEPINVSESELQNALMGLDPEIKAALETAIDRVRRVSEANLPKGTSIELALEAEVSQRWVPIESVGLYVPGEKLSTHRASL